jgi:F-type H+-transporting ATPase subunit gamma
MTHRHNLEHHRQGLAEIREIMNAMKTLAYMETRKLGRFLDAQRAVVQNIEDMATDLLSFHPASLPESKKTASVFLLIGTERGFCGDYNQALLHHLEAALQEHPADSPMLIAVGRKLHTVLEGDARVAALIDGASVVEELSFLLGRLADALTSLQERHGIVTVFCIYHDSEDGIVMQKLLPPFQHLLHKPPQFSHPPMLHQSAGEVLVELAEHYLFAALNQMLYTSLMMENYRRVSHLEGAVKHLDDEAAELAQQCNALRQEEIIEEIEVILLSASSLDENSHEPE